MSHNNKIHDTETHFIIDPSTRTITNSSADNNIIVQYDHNSERFTFEIPRYIDGHDMSECTEVRVNYRNSASTGLSKTDGWYICDDLAISETDDDKVTFSWLLSSTSTQYIGFLYFSIQFICFDDDGSLIYSWNTGIYKDITIVESINNVEDVVASDSFKEFNDLLSDAKETITMTESAIESANVATENANAAAETARASVCYIRKTTDGKLQILDADLNVIDTVDVCYMDNDTIYRYTDGVLSVFGIKELNADKTFRMWVGTNAEFNALSETDENTFYWMTDDATYNEIENAINALNETVTELEEALQNGEVVVKRATTADGAPSKGTQTKDTESADGMAFTFANTNGFGIKNAKDYFKLWSRENTDGEYSTALAPSTNELQELGMETRKFSKVWSKIFHGNLKGTADEATNADHATEADHATTADGAPSKGTQTNDTTDSSGMAFAFTNTNGFGIRGNKDYFKLWYRQNSNGENSTSLVPSTNEKQGLGASDRKFDNIWTDKINGSKCKKLLWDYKKSDSNSDNYLCYRIKNKQNIDLSTHGSLHTSNLAAYFLTIELMESKYDDALGENYPTGGYKYIKTNNLFKLGVGEDGGEYTEYIDTHYFTFSLLNSSTITVSTTASYGDEKVGYYISKIYGEQ